jgi:hypothetical protein
MTEVRSTPLEVFADQYRGSTPETLRRLEGDAFLVLWGAATLEGASTYATHGSGEGEPAPRPPPDATLVCSLQPPGTDRFMVTVGRTRRSDIALDTPAISKFHAYLRRDRRGGFTVGDGGSHNGTRVGQRELVPNQPEPIEAGAQITFGKVIQGDFHDARTLIAFLRELPLNL